jgi:PAS domain-containing protein
MTAAPGDTRAALVRVWVVSDLKGIVLDASAHAKEVFGVTRRGLIGRNLYTFFDAERPMIMQCADVAASEQPVALAGWLRPRDAKPVSIHFTIQRESRALVPSLLWNFR